MGDQFYGMIRRSKRITANDPAAGARRQGGGRVGLGDRFADHLELAQIDRHHPAHARDHFVVEISRIAHRLHRDLVVRRQAQAEPLKCCGTQMEGFKGLGPVCLPAADGEASDLSGCLCRCEDSPRLLMAINQAIEIAGHHLRRISSSAASTQAFNSAFDAVHRMFKIDEGTDWPAGRANCRARHPISTSCIAFVA